MRTTRIQVGRGLVAAGIVVACCIGSEKEVRATLGGDVASVDANLGRLGGERRVQTVASGKRHDLRLPSGIVVHEYVSAAGAVYAIAWEGPRAPDLRELLGPYFDQLSVRDLRQPVGHHRLEVNGTDLVVRSSGHRGSFFGRAWVPSLLPRGVDPRTSLDVQQAPDPHGGAGR
jgi:hypothetical protein